VRGRIEAVLDYAKARKWRGEENPARWRGHLDQLLPRRSKVLPGRQAAGDTERRDRCRTWRRGDVRRELRWRERERLRPRGWRRSDVKGKMVDRFMTKSDRIWHLTAPRALRCGSLSFYCLQ
jgi:hypothetical protein